MHKLKVHRQGLFAENLQVPYNHWFTLCTIRQASHLQAILLCDASVVTTEQVILSVGEKSSPLEKSYALPWSDVFLVRILIQEGPPSSTFSHALKRPKILVLHNVS